MCVILMINGLNAKAHFICMYLYCVRRRAMMVACRMKKQDLGRLFIEAFIPVVKCYSINPGRDIVFDGKSKKLSIQGVFAFRISDLKMYMRPCHRTGSAIQGNVFPLFNRK